jgi:hypothetical protein
LLINIGKITDTYSDGSKNTINGVSKRRYIFMSSISGISSASAVVNSDSKSTTTSSASDWSDEFQKILSGTSGSGNSSSNNDGSKTTIERTVTVGADGSTIITITQITTAANGSQSSKVISQTKMGGSTIDSASGKSDSDALFNKSQLQESMGKNAATANYANNEYEKNSDIGMYVSGVALKKEC